jgi:hypothetical protein
MFIKEVVPSYVKNSRGEKSVQIEVFTYEGRKVYIEKTTTVDMNKKLAMSFVFILLVGFGVLVSAGDSSCNEDGYCILFEGEEISFDNHTFSIGNFIFEIVDDVMVENQIALIIDGEITNLINQREKWFNQELEIYINDISPAIDDSEKGEVRFQVGKYTSPKNLVIENIEFGGNPKDYVPNSGNNLMVGPVFSHEGLLYGDDFFMNVEIYDVDRNRIGGCGYKIAYIGEGRFEGKFCGDNNINLPGIYIFEITLNTNEGWLDEIDYSDNVLEKAVCVGKEDCSEIEEVERIVRLKNSCQSCFLDDECYPLGYRKKIEESYNYCEGYSNWQVQLDEGSCENNFECKSNVCVSGECVSEGLLQKILNWFKNLFS